MWRHQNYKVAKSGTGELQLRESLLSGNKSLYHVYNWDLKFSNKSAPPLNPNATSAGVEILRLNPMLAAAQVADANDPKPQQTTKQFRPWSLQLRQQS